MTDNECGEAMVQRLCSAVLNGRSVEARTLASKLYHSPKDGPCRPPREPRVMCWFDGGCLNNPGGHGSYGALVKRDGRTILSSSVYLGAGSHMTNNVAEYAGVIRVLRFLISEGIQWANIYGDSRLVIDQLNDRIKAKRGVYFSHYREARELLEKLPSVRLKWISRGQNIEADALANTALAPYRRQP